MLRYSSTCALLLVFPDGTSSKLSVGSILDSDPVLLLCCLDRRPGRLPAPGCSQMGGKPEYMLRDECRFWHSRLHDCLSASIHLMFEGSPELRPRSCDVELVWVSSQAPRSAAYYTDESTNCSIRPTLLLVTTWCGECAAMISSTSRPIHLHRQELEGRNR
jgi:hypothetical protein